MNTERLQKYLSRAGVASRRHAELMITEGRVWVNGKKVTVLGTKVDPEVDQVTVDGRSVAVADERTYLLLYKPPNVVTTLQDPQGRPTVADFFTPGESRVFPIGRLDYDAEGALLLTDDGDLANKLMHPKFGVERTYLVKVKGIPSESALEKLRGGVRLEDGMATPKTVERYETAEKNTWIKLVVTEGRPHLIKRLCAAIGHPVLRLFRPSHAGINLAGLRPGQIRRLQADEVRTLMAVAGGEAAPPTELKLPARRHRAEEESAQAAQGEESPRPERNERRQPQGRGFKQR
ncbi:MAG: rluB [Myxococcaceae bacterium]|nr:rluB [Myxococcaceae bacterium]